MNFKCFHKQISNHRSFSELTYGSWYKIINSQYKNSAFHNGAFIRLQMNQVTVLSNNGIIIYGVNQSELTCCEYVPVSVGDVFTVEFE